MSSMRGDLFKRKSCIYLTPNWKWDGWFHAKSISMLHWTNSKRNGSLCKLKEALLRVRERRNRKKRIDGGQAQTRKQPLSLTLSPPPSLSLSPPPTSVPLSLSLSLFYYLVYSLFLPLSRTLTLSLSPTLSIANTHTNSHKHTQTHLFSWKESKFP